MSCEKNRVARAAAAVGFVTSINSLTTSRASFGMRANQALMEAFASSLSRRRSKRLMEARQRPPRLDLVGTRTP